MNLDTINAEINDVYAQLEVEERYFPVEVQDGPTRLQERLEVLRFARGSLSALHLRVLRLKDDAVQYRRACQARLELGDQAALQELRDIRYALDRFKGLLVAIAVQDAMYGRAVKDVSLVLAATRMELRMHAGSWYRGQPKQVDLAALCKPAGSKSRGRR